MDNGGEAGGGVRTVGLVLFTPQETNSGVGYRTRIAARVFEAIRNRPVEQKKNRLKKGVCVHTSLRLGGENTYSHSSSFCSRRGRSFVRFCVREKRRVRPACPRDEASSSSSSESDLHRIKTQPLPCSLNQRGWQSSNALAGRTFCSRPEKRHHPCTRLKSFKHGARSSGVNILLSR